MSRWTYAALLSVAVISLVSARAAEPTVSLDEAVARALNASPKVKARDELVGGAEAGVRQSSAMPNPEVDAELENFAGSGPFKDLNESELTLGVSQRIERGGKRSGRVAVATAERDIAAIERDKSRFDAILEARRAFYEVCAAGVLLRARKTALDSATQIEAMARRRVASARDPVTVKLRAEIQTASARGEYERAQTALQAAKKKLATLWGTNDIAYDVEEKAFLAIPEKDLAVDPSASPDLLASEAAVRRAAAKVDAEKASASSDVSVGVGIRRFEVGGDVAGVVSLSVPLAIWDTNQGNIDRAAAERRAADLDVAEARRAAEREVMTLQTEVKNASAEAVSLRKELLPRAEQALSAARRGYDAGAFSYLELSESMRTLGELRAREVEVLRELHFARAALDRYAGQEAEMPAVEKPAENLNKGSEQ